MSVSIARVDRPQGLCAAIDSPCGKSLTIALGMISMIGGLVATGLLYQTLGMLSFACAGGGFALSSLLILRAACKKPELVLHPVVRLDYANGLTPAYERENWLHACGNDMSIYSWIPTGAVRGNDLTPLQNRAVGVVLGGIIGDMAGIPYNDKPFNSEGYSAEKISEQWTADASLGLCLADMLIAGERVLNDTQFLWAMHDCLQYGYNRYTLSENAVHHQVDMLGLESVSRGSQIAVRPASNRVNPGIGPLIRNGAVALIAQDVNSARDLAGQQCKVTHGDYRTVHGCRMMASYIFAAIHAEIEVEIIKAQILAMVQSPINENPAKEDMGPIDALKAALYSVLTTDCFEAAIRQAVRHGGRNASAVGAIAGQIAGAIYGRGGIPKKWIENVRQHDRYGEVEARGYLLTL